MKNNKLLLFIALATLTLGIMLDSPLKYVAIGFSTVAFLATILQTVNRN